ncbi:MAG: flavodoxin domain-containing protein [Thiotrichales bacterium]
MLENFQACTIFSATVHGAAQYVAEEINLNLNNAGVRSTLFTRADFEDVFSCTGLAIFCVSTTGEGELPRAMQAVYDEMAKHPRPLKGLNYLSIVLGDSSYGEEMFCRGGRRLHQLLMKLGATPLAQPLLIDAELTNNPEEVAEPWIKSLFGLESS